MATFDNLPLYECTIDADNCGIVRISLVDRPAVDKDFVALKAAPLRLQVASEERRIVRGVVVRADYPIYRNDEDGEYYIIYTAPVIRQIAERFLKDGRQNYVNIMHATGDIDGVHLVELYIKDSAAGIAPAGFDDVADGSLFAEYRVERDDVWQAIREGTFRGFSLEGYFRLLPAREIERTQKNKKSMKNNLFKKALAALRRIMLGALTTDGGVLYWNEDGELAVGLAVEIEGEDGVRVPAPDGDYTAEDGTVYTVEGGIVTKIEKPAEEAPVEGEPVEGDDDVPEEPAEEPAEAPAATVPSLEDTIDELNRRVVELADRVEALEEAVRTILEAIDRQAVEMKAQRTALKAVQQQPAAKPAHKAFKAQAKNTGMWGSETLDFSNLKK